MTQVKFTKCISRRKFLSSSVLTAGLMAVPGLAKGSLAATIGSHLVGIDAVGQAAMVHRGEVSPTKLAQEAIERIKTLNPDINAVVSSQFDEALTRAEKLPKGPFRGVPFLLKDLIEMKGFPTEFGSRMMKGNISSKSHAFVKAIEASGLNILGKTNTPEFGLLGTTEPLAFGPTRNPWNLEYSAGGSSGGAAAAVASGMVPVAQGSDGGGSVRIPAACCGLFGMKVTRKRNVWNGRLGLFGFSVKGHITRTVRDSVALTRVTEWKGADAPYSPVGLVTGPSKRRLKIGIYFENLKGNMPSDTVVDAIEKTATLCRDLGHSVSPVKLPFDGKLYSKYFTAVWSRVPAGLVTRAGSKAPDILEPWSLYLADYFKKTGADDFDKALAYVKHLQGEMEKLYQQYDVILSPVLSDTALPLGRHRGDRPGDELMEDVSNYVGYTSIYNGTGQPAMSVPLFWSDEGLPVGSHFSAKLGDEKTLYELAFELELAKPWKDKWAPHSAYYL